MNAFLFQFKATWLREKKIMGMRRILELEGPWKLSSLTMGKPVTIQMTSGVYKNVDSHPEPLNQMLRASGLPAKNIGSFHR